MRSGNIISVLDLSFPTTLLSFPTVPLLFPTTPLSFPWKRESYLNFLRLSFPAWLGILPKFPINIFYINEWIPAFAGMTKGVGMTERSRNGIPISHFPPPTSHSPFWEWQREWLGVTEEVGMTREKYVIPNLIGNPLPYYLFLINNEKTSGKIGPRQKIFPKKMRVVFATLSAGSGVTSY